MMKEIVLEYLQKLSFTLLYDVNKITKSQLKYINLLLI
jgi:hypothetical protein